MKRIILHDRIKRPTYNQHAMMRDTGWEPVGNGLYQKANEVAWFEREKGVQNPHFRKERLEDK